jgi:1,4-alpha-glucan branching enzyme
MPTAEFAGDYSWGYNPAHIFAVESIYGGPRAFKKFVRECHRHGIAVILDVVYNHFGPSDLDLWQFDGWSQHGMGGIYFYNDWKAKTPWGDTRPDYGRGEVRQFIHDNAMMWLEDYHVDGLRYDMTLFIRNVTGTGHPGDDLPEGWSLKQWINRDIRERFPGRILIAEDLQNNEWIAKSAGEGGAAFHSQWDANFVHPIRAAVIVASDEHRSMTAVRDALQFRYNGDAFQRVIYSESHDEVANGKARVPTEVNASDPTGWYAQKRSTLAAGLVFTAPGIPMLFQGQEFLQGEWFRDDVPLDWDLNQEFRGIVRLYRDLIRLRLNRDGKTRGLCGQGMQVTHVNDASNIIAFYRWDKGGPKDEVVVVANFSTQSVTGYRIGVPRKGLWKLRLNSDWAGYSPDFSDFDGFNVTAEESAYDGQPCSVEVNIAPYSLLIYSQDGAG